MYNFFNIEVSTLFSIYNILNHIDGNEKFVILNCICDNANLCRSIYKFVRIGKKS